MALKFEIIGNNLVVTETGDSTVKLERPAADVYGVCEDGKWKIFTRSQRSDQLLSSDYANIVDSAGAALTKITLTTFFRTKLGFSKAGSSALTTIQGTYEVGQTLTAVPADGVTATGFQWYRDGVVIVGATKSTYLMQDIDQGKVLTVALTGSVISKATNPAPALIIARPSVLQASPLGAADGGKRNIATTGHNSMQMFMAASNTIGTEIGFSNVSIFDTGNTAEYVSPDTLEVKGYLFLPNATWTSRPFIAGGLAQGATGGTLAANAIETAMYLFKFSTGELRWVSCSANSPEVTWRKGLKQAATSAATYKMGNGTYWRRIQLSDTDGSTTFVFPGGVKTLKKLSIADAPQIKGVPGYIGWYVTKQGGGNFSLPAQQLPNGQDELSNGLQEAIYDNASDQSGQFFGKAPWIAAGFGTGSYRALSIKGIGCTGANYRPVTIWGDSIPSSKVSYIQQYFHAKGIPYELYSKAGQAPADFVTQSVIRQQLTDKGVLLVQLGVNGYNLPALQALWALGRSLGFTKIGQVLATNRPPSPTSDWSTEEAQGEDMATLEINASIVALVGQANGPDFVWDVNTCTRGVNPRKTAGGMLTDGTHYGLATNAILAAAEVDNVIQHFALAA